MQTPRPGQVNALYGSVITRADGDPITSGTVNAYLVAIDGANAGKWFRGSDQSWQAAEAIAAVASHKGDAEWLAAVHADAWTANLRYRLYFKEDGDLHIPGGEEVVCTRAASGTGAISDTMTVTVSGTPVAGFDVWVSTDEAGDNVIAGVLVTNAQGVVTFDLDIASGLWAHAQKAGYNATGYPKEFNVAAGGFEWA